MNNKKTESATAIKHFSQFRPFAKSEFEGCSDEHCVHDDALRATMISLRENDDMIAPKRGEATHRLRSNHRLA